MEWKLPYTTCLTTAIDSLEKQAKFVCYEHLKNPIEKMKMELTFLHMFFSGLDYLKESDYDWYLCFSINTLVAKLGQIGNEFAADCESGDGHGRWLDLEAVMYGWEEKLHKHLIRSRTKDVCNLLLGGTFKCTYYSGSHKKFNECVEDTTYFYDLIQVSIKALLDSGLIAPVMKQQIYFIQQGLKDYSMFVGPPDKPFDLIAQTRAWLSSISCLTYLYWIDGNDESLASIMETMLHGLLKKNLPCPTSRVISSHLQPTMIPQILSLHLDFLLGDLILFGKGDSDILEEGFMFMLSFIMDPPDIDSKDEGMTWAQIYATINKFLSLIYSIRLDEMKEEILKASFSDFLMKVNRVKALVRDHNLFVVVPYSSQFTSPDTNAMGFLNNLVENLRSMLKMEVNLIPCLRTHGESLCNELELFGPFLKNIMQLLKNDGDKAIKDLFEETINMIYNVDYFTKLCLIKISTWYVIIALPGVIEHIKFIKIQINKLFGVEQMHTEQRIGDHKQMEGLDALRQRGMDGTENDSVGFKEVEENISHDLTRGPMSLTIISISGSGGQGKTTLAKRIYDNSNVRYHFHKSVWCNVSKNCLVKDLLINMLVDTKDGDANELEMEDLIVDVWRSLKGKRYLIVLDDVWDIDVLDQLTSSFPDDKKGSRILLTSRNQDLASQVKLNLISISHPLPLFSDEESWELMKKRVFGSNGCEEEIMEIGEIIASYCQGLPLAVALIAGVLGRTERTLDSWNKVAENLKTHLAEEGCGNVLELSYKNLPDHLKPCFLFFAAFRRGKIFKAKRLKLLWIGEGFANQYGETKRSEEDLATEYLRDLVSLGLVAVTKWSTIRGRIKTCNIHDFLYDLCLEKAKENNFMHWAELNGDNEQNILSSSWLLKYNHHRLRIGESDPFIKSSPVLARRELPTSSLHSFLCTSWASRELSLCFLESFKILTVLKLKLRVEEFPEVILSSTCLRYLFLHFERRIKAITPKIANLWKLRTLIMKFPLRHMMTLLPFVLWNMMSLRHVNVELAGLDLVGVDPENSSKSNIQSLGWLVLDVDHGTTTGFFKKFPNLRWLKFSQGKVQWHILEFLSMAGSLLTQLESLNFIHGGEFEENPPKDWNCAELLNLTKLRLISTNIPWSVLSDIGKKLPNLHVLKLEPKSCKGSSWKMEHGDFPNLRHLRLIMLSIENFDVPCDGNPFPSLEFLSLYDCKELQEIPLVFGEDNTLKRIDVFGGSKELKASALKILEDQREFGNENFHIRDMDQDEFDRRLESYKIDEARRINIY